MNRQPRLPDLRGAFWRIRLCYLFAVFVTVVLAAASYAALRGAIAPLDYENAQEFVYLERLESGVLIATLVILAAEVLLIFYPMERRIFRQQQELLAAIENIQQQKQAHAQLAAIVESSNDAIYGKTLDEIVTSWNTAAERLYGYSAGAMIGQPVTILVPPEQQNEMPVILNRLRRGERIERYETRRLRKDGRLIDVSLTISPILDESGVIVGAATIAHDITAQKRDQKALAQSEARYRLLARNLPDMAVLLFDRDLRLLLAEGEFLPRLGYPKEAIEGKTLADVVPAESYDFLLPHYQAVLDGQEVQFESERRGYIYQAHALPLYDDQEQVSGGMFVLYDVTERRKVEMEKAGARLLSTFIRDTSHELRTPLTIIQTSVDLLRRLTDADKRTQRLDTIQEQVQHLQRLIEEMYTMLDLEIGGSFSPRSLDLNQVAEEVLSAYYPQIHDRGLQVSLEMQPDLPPVDADERQLFLALSELLKNALRYTPDSGRIIIRTVQRQGEASIEITDTGIGISTNDLPHIFERFYKADKARTFNDSGMGLGLAMVKKIAEAHRGRIEVESEPEKGSLFRLRLPVRQKA